MSSTATERGGRARPLAPLLLPLLAALAAGLWGCAEEPLPKARVNREDCLRGLNMKHLPEAIARCDAVVKAFPNDPFPLNERFLLHTLQQNRQAACRDIVRANALARQPKAPPPDALLRQDLKLRLASCLPRSASVNSRPATGASAGETRAEPVPAAR